MNNNKCRSSLFIDRKGQVVVWIVLISVVGLTLGLSIASRSLSNIQQASELEETNRAFSAAEAGIEEALYALESTGAASSVLIPVSLSEAGSEYSYIVSEGGGGNELILAAPLTKDNVVQVNCSGMSGNLTVYWVKDGTSQDQDGNRASLLLTFISQESVPASDYEVIREAYNPFEEHTSRGNGFLQASSITETVGGIDFREKTASILLPGAGTDQILRIQAFYNGVPNTIALKADSSFPSQYHTITSTGSAGDVERTVQVTRSNPSLPAFFDYTLFNLSTNSLSK
ncbi:hypothetical protein KKB83_00745 [Patescibacteria group bacterium]|nr:hypothetical protein [Patescibacteria group bacterium]